MRRHLLLLPLTFSLPFAPHSMARASDPMRELDYLIGRWTGEGSILLGPEGPQPARVTEVAESKLGGELLLIEGTGVALIEGEEKQVHHGLALIRYDREAGGYRALTCKAGGICSEVEVVVGDRTARWGFDDERVGTVRYRLRITESGEWHEVGEVSRDMGATWVKFMEMTLRRQTPPREVD